ncbi:ABC transporter substrate-binding protein [Salinicoccus kekensis]|uniref:Iron(III) transport system substrate-binding protein n=1 Tax=Salinicoccus kekensis TaxID=714307 RepID=A0A285UI47_9STAP|nr:ABC transporter substrate-binding protein [Salinicoccus kekensis]SOC41078.1 iron(III) transport system substrate-binding protein [Salinicoccus kekensis]
MNKWFTLSLMSVFVLMLSACGNGGTDEEDTSAENVGNPDDSISGTLDFYTSQPDIDAEQLIDAFNEQYPEVDINLFRSGTEEVISKVNAENEAGDVIADVLLVADDATFEGLKQEDLLHEYESPEAESIPEEFADPDGTYYGTKIMATVMAVNSENVDEIPDSWQVLTEDNAHENIVMPSPLYSGAAAYNLGVFTRSDDFGWEFYEGIKDNNPMITEGNGAVIENVASGAQDYGMVVDYLVARAMQDGSPVELVYPSEGVPVITEPIGIMKDSDNLEASEAFVDFVLSEEGQQLQSDIGYTPIREGIDAPEGLQSFEEIDALTAPVEELYENRESDKDQFDELFNN